MCRRAAGDLLAWAQEAYRLCPATAAAAAADTHLYRYNLHGEDVGGGDAFLEIAGHCRLGDGLLQRAL